MNSSTDKILTTHVGSLPRSDALLGMLTAKEEGQEVDDKRFRSQVREEMAQVVRNDGELPRIGFSIYAKNRMAGFDGLSNRGTVTDFDKFPQYAAFLSKRAGFDITASATIYDMPECVRAVQYDPDMRQAREELDLFEEVLAAESDAAATFSGTFVTAATPGIVSTTMLRSRNNPDYGSDEEYVYGLAILLRAAMSSNSTRRTWRSSGRSCIATGH